MSRVILEETTVADVGSVRVGCGNFWERTWTAPDGTVRTGMSAKVAPFDREDDVVVGVDSTLEIDGTVWVVESLDKEPGELGRIVLAPRGESA